MVSIRKRRPPGRSQTGAASRTNELQQTVRYKHRLSDEGSGTQIEAEEKPIIQALEQADCDNELEENRNVLGERRDVLVTGLGASSEAVAAVPTQTRRFPYDQVKNKMMSMASILERAEPADPVKALLKLDLDEMPAADSYRFMALPAVKLNRDDHDPSDEEDEDTEDDDQDWVMPEEEYVHESSGEMSDCSLEGRQNTEHEQVVQESKSVGERVALRRKEKSDQLVPDSRLVDMEVTDMQSDLQVDEVPKRSKRRCRGSSNPDKYQFPKNKIQGEVGAPISNGHFLGESSTFNNDLPQKDDALENMPEGSLKHSVYSVVLVYGGEGISIEDLLTSLYIQRGSAMLANDWEDDVRAFLKSSSFVEVQGQYILRSLLLDHHPCSSRFAKGKEKMSETDSYQLATGKEKMSETDSYQLAIGKEKMFETDSYQLDCGSKIDVQDTQRKGEKIEGDEGGRVATFIEEPATRVQVHGSLIRKAKTIIVENGFQEKVRRCYLSSRQWQCPLPAMDNKKLCEHHFEKAEAAKNRAKEATRKKAALF